AFGGIATHAVLVRIAPSRRAPNSTGSIQPHAVRDGWLGHLHKHFSVRQFSGGNVDIEHANMARVLRIVGEAGIDDVKLLLVRRQGNAVRLHEIIGHDLDVTGFRIDPVDIVLLLLGLLFEALVVAADSVDRVGKPDRTIGSDNDVVGRVQLLAVVLVGDDGDRAVELGPSDPSPAMLASDQSSLSIDGVAVRVHRRLAEYADVTVILRNSHDAVVGNVAEHHVAPCREVARTLGPAESGCDALNCAGAGEGREAGWPERWTLGLLHGFDVRIRIDAAW